MSATIDQIPTTTVLPRADDFAESGGRTDGVPRSSKVLLQNFPQKVATIAALKALDITNAADGVAVLVLGYYAAGDGGGGMFRYSSVSATADNGGTVIAPNVGAGRWIRPVAPAVDVRWFGAKGDNASDDAHAIQAALNLGGVIEVPFGDAGSYVLGTGLLIPSYTTLQVSPRVRFRTPVDIGAALIANSDPIGGNSNIHILNGLWDGENSNSVPFAGIQFTNVNNSTIENVTVRNMFNGVTIRDYGAIDLRKSSRIRIINCDSSSAQIAGLYGYDCDHIHVIDGEYSNVAGQSGVDLTKCPYSLVRNVRAENNSASGVSINSQYSAVIGCYCAGNQWGLNMGHNAADASASHSIADANISVNNTKVGLQIQAGTTVGVVTGINIVRGNLTDYVLPAETLADVYSNAKNGDGTTTPGLKRHIVGTIGFPNVGGNNQTGVLRLQGEGSNGVLDFSVNGGLGAALQVTDQTNLSNNFPLYLNPNGGELHLGSLAGTKIKGVLTMERPILLYSNVVNYVTAIIAGAGAVYLATDCTATTPGTVAAGGGANRCVVVSDGVNWIIL